MTQHDSDLMVNETLRTISNRHSVRMFTADAVTEQEIQTLLQAANAAPSAHNQQAWRFTIIKGARKQELAQLVTAQSARFPKPAAALLRMGAKSIISAPVIIAVANTGDLIRHGTELFKVEKETAHDFFRTMEIQSSAAAVENMLLAATSLGLGAVWLGVLYLIKDEVLRFLEEPEGEFMAVVPVGRPARTGRGPQKQPVGMKVRILG
jgi:nitroreductase